MKSLVLNFYLLLDVLRYYIRREDFHMSISVLFHSLLDYLNVSLILELNSEFRDFKLWDQKLQFKGLVSKILLEYF